MKRHLEEIITNIVKLGEKLDNPVVATGNVHYLNPKDKIYRKILSQFTRWSKSVKSPYSYLMFISEQQMKCWMLFHF